MTTHPNHGHFRRLAAAVTPSAGRPTTPLHAYGTARASAAGESTGGGMEAAGMDVGRRRCTCTLTTTLTTTVSSAPGDRDGFRPAADDPWAWARHPPTSGGRRKGRTGAWRPPEWTTCTVEISNTKWPTGHAHLEVVKLRIWPNGATTLSITMSTKGAQRRPGRAATMGSLRGRRPPWSWCAEEVCPIVTRRSKSKKASWRQICIYIGR